MDRTWFFTVFSARNRDDAISPLVWPSAISDMTSDSRADSDLLLSGTCSIPGISPRLMRPPLPAACEQARGRRPISPLWISDLCVQIHQKATGQTVSRATYLAGLGGRGCREFPG